MVLTPRLERIVSETFNSHRQKGNSDLTEDETLNFFSKIGINKNIPSTVFKKQVMNFLTDPRFSKTREDISSVSFSVKKRGKISEEIFSELYRKKDRFLYLVSFSQDTSSRDLKTLSDSFEQEVNEGLESYVGSGYKTVRTHLHRKIDDFVEQILHFPKNSQSIGNQEPEIFYEGFMVPFVSYEWLPNSSISPTFQEHPDILKRLLQSNFDYFESTFLKNNEKTYASGKFRVWDYLRILEWFTKESDVFGRVLDDLLICKKALEESSDQTDNFRKLENKFKYSRLKPSFQRTLLSQGNEDVMGSSQNFEDADQEFRITLSRAASKYGGRNLASFKTFLDNILRNETVSRYRFLETHKRKTNQSVYLASSLDEGECSHLAREVNNFLAEEFRNFEGNPYSFGKENMCRVLWERNCPVKEDKTTNRVLSKFRSYLNRRKKRLSKDDMIPPDPSDASMNELYLDLTKNFGENQSYFLQPNYMELLSESEHEVYSIFGAPGGEKDKAEFITLCLKTPEGYKIPESSKEFNLGSK